MKIALSHLLAIRSIRSQQRGFVSFISLASVLGIALGMTVLLTVLSVMNGFQKEVRERMLSLTPHVILMPPIPFTLEQSHQLKSYLPADIQNLPITPWVEGPVMFLGQQGGMTGGMLRGVDPQTVLSVLPIAAHMKQGKIEQLSPGTYGIILGQGLASQLGVGVGDFVTVILPEAHVGLAGVLPRLKRLKVEGIFSVEYTYDNGMAFVHIMDAARLLHHQNTIDGLQVAVKDALRAPIIARAWREQLPGWQVVDWTLQHQTYFRAVQTEKTMMFLILMLLIAVAAFNLVSMLVMTVDQKRGDIAILRAMGASKSLIIKTFVAEGMFLGVTGIILGLLGGIILSHHVTEVVSFLERLLHTHFISSDVYFIDFLPSEFHWKDAIGVVITAFFMSIFATLYPAWKAASIWPAEALRYE